MTEKTETQVVIDGKVLTVGGYESGDYLQRVASYINNKIQDFKKKESFLRANLEIKQRMIELNIADDYFKEKEKTQHLESEIKIKQDEMYALKHEIIAKDMTIDASKQKIADLEAKLQEQSKRIVQLETELKEKVKK